MDAGKKKKLHAQPQPYFLLGKCAGGSSFYRLQDTRALWDMGQAPAFCRLPSSPGQLPRRDVGPKSAAPTVHETHRLKDPTCAVDAEL
jgi:hypothetical protein